MPQLDSQRAVTRDRYDAVLLDLDGVITDTASIHAACWKQMFDEYLRKRATGFVPSTSPRTTVSMWKGSPATTAFATFSHRAVSGSPREAPQAETVDGLGNRKNDLGQQNHRRERGRALRGER